MTREEARRLLRKHALDIRLHALGLLGQMLLPQVYFQSVLRDLDTAEKRLEEAGR
jgi:hypothetical protein